MSRRAALRTAVAGAMLAVGAPVAWHTIAAGRLTITAAAVDSIPAARIGAALAIVATGQLALALIDWITLESVATGARAGAERVRMSLVSSIAAHGLGQAVGVAALTGGAIRRRYHARAAVPLAATASVTAVATIVTWLGAAVVFFIAIAAGGGTRPAPAFLATVPARILAAIITIMLVLVPLATVTRARRILVIRGTCLRLPDARGVAVQLLAATLDWTLAVLALRILLPSGAPPFATLTALFVGAQAGAIASTVPAGLGVFDAAMLAALAPAIGAAHALTGLLAFRVVYYAVPAALAGLLLAAGELRGTGAALVRRAVALRAPARSADPAVLAGATFATGLVLLASGATPPVAARAIALHAVSPGPLIDGAYLASSLVGAALLLVARGLHRRLGAAYGLAVPLLATGVLVSLLKGLDYEEAVMAAATLLMLLPARRIFRRPSSFVAERFSPSWIAAITAGIGGTVWLALFSAGYVGAAGFIPFTFRSEEAAARAVLSGVVAAAACVMVALGRLLRLVQPAVPLPDRSETERARAVVRGTAETSAHLALVGDKAFVFSPGGDALLMYGIAGNSWIAMGDPVGAPVERAALARRFRDLALCHGGRPVFYHVTGANLAAYVELGLTVRKVGECARVALRDFTLAGGSRKWLRKAHRAATAAGCRFELVPQPGVCALLPDLKRVSDAWLRSKRGREKAFSLGYFDERYIVQCPVATVWQGARLVAFANVWIGSDMHELSVDLMRYVSDGPPEVIDYLFSELMLWGQENGFEWFDLGVAPLAGLDAAGTPLLWNRLGALLFRVGARGYNFAGLRRYKAKFAPEWSSRYIAAPGGLELAGAVVDVAALIGAGPPRDSGHAIRRRSAAA